METCPSYPAFFVAICRAPPKTQNNANVSLMLTAYSKIRKRPDVYMPIS